MEFECEARVRLGLILRSLVTLIIFSYLKFFNKHDKNLLLLIVVKILLLDAVDSLPSLFYKGSKDTCWNPCTRYPYYQKWDKLIDLASYILILVALNYDVYLFILIVWRIIGVILFSKSENRNWLIPFFDFIKEYLIYIFLFGKNNFKYIWVFFLGKIGFEYYFHRYRLLTNRCLNNETRS